MAVMFLDIIIATVCSVYNACCYTVAQPLAAWGPAASRRPSEQLAVSTQDLHLKWKANKPMSTDA